MKNAILAFFFFALSITAANAQIWSAIKNSGMELKQPDASYQVEAKGMNFRVYEWTPESAENKLCIATFSETGMSVQCMDKGADQE